MFKYWWNCYFNCLFLPCKYSTLNCVGTSTLLHSPLFSPRVPSHAGHHPTHHSPSACLRFSPGLVPLKLSTDGHTDVWTCVQHSLCVCVCVSVVPWRGDQRWEWGTLEWGAQRGTGKPDATSPLVAQKSNSVYKWTNIQAVLLGVVAWLFMRFPSSEEEGAPIGSRCERSSSAVTRMLRSSRGSGLKELLYCHPGDGCYLHCDKNKGKAAFIFAAQQKHTVLPPWL